MKLLKNKKAIATSLIVDFWALVAYFLIFIIVYVSVIMSSRLEADICIEQIKEDKTMELLNVLKTQIDVNNEKITVAEYAARYADDKSIGTDDAKTVLEPIITKIDNRNPGSDIYCIDFAFTNREKVALSE